MSAPFLIKLGAHGLGKVKDSPDACSGQGWDNWKLATGKFIQMGVSQAQPAKPSLLPPGVCISKNSMSNPGVR